MRAAPVRSAPNTVLHPWLRAEWAAIRAACPPAPDPPVPGTRWIDWLLPDHPPILPLAAWPPLRRLRVWDNLAGQHRRTLVQWCLAHGILPLDTPIAGSWLTMAASVQRIIVRRALAGQHPEQAQQVVDWLAEAVRGGNADPTPFVWGGTRAARRQRARERRHAQGGSGASTRRPGSRRAYRPDQQNGYVHAE